MNRLFKTSIMIMLLFSLALGALAQDILVAPFVKRAPAIDGVLDDEAWEIAAEKGGKGEIAYFLNSVSIKEDKSDVYVCWDDDFLYVAFKNYQDQKTIIAETANDGGNIWVTDDDNEIFISTTYPGTSPYIQAITNALGTRSGFNGNLEWEAAGQIYEDYWITEVAIPFYALNAYPDDGDEWAINLTRRYANDPGGPTEWRTWSSMPITTFLDPLVFGLLEFVR